MSKVWNYFVKCECNSRLVTCKLCKVTLKRPLGNTTNLWKHYAKCSNKSLPEGNGEIIGNQDQPKKRPRGSYAKRSPVWNSFTAEKNALYATCNSCQHPVKFPGGNTTSLWKHKKLCSDIQKGSVQTTQRTIPKHPKAKVKKVRKKIKTSTGRKQSKVWNYFSRNPGDKGSAICHICKNIIRRPFGNTTNLWAHHRKCSQAKHMTEVNSQLVNDLKSQDDKTFSDTDAAVSNPQKLATSILTDDQKDEIYDKTCATEQLSSDDNTAKTLVNEVHDLCALDSNVSELSMLSLDIISFLIQDLPSHNALDGVGFYNLMQKAYPFAAISKKQNLKCLSDLKEDVDQRVTEILGLAPSLSLSIQSYETQGGYLCLTIFVHFYDLQHNLYLLPMSSKCTKAELMIALRFYHASSSPSQLFLLIREAIEPYLCKSLLTSHASQCAMPLMKQEESSFYQTSCNVLERPARWRPNVSHVTIGTNCLLGKAIESGSTLQGYQTVVCLRSQLRQIIGNVLQDQMDKKLSESIQRAQDICDYFQQTRKALIRLERIQVNLGRPQPLLLAPDSSRTCLPLYQMLSRCVELKSEICMLGETTDKICSSLKQSDWEIYLSLVNATQPIEKAIEKSSGETSLAEGIPIVVGLCETVEKLKSDNDNRDVDNFFVKLCEQCCSLKHRFLDNEDYLTSTFLHPGLRCHIPVTTMERISHFITKTNLDDTVCNMNDSSSTLDTVTFQPNIKQQVQQYLKDSSSISTNPIYYWSEYQTVWPDLSKLALKFLKVPLSVLEVDPEIFKSPAVCCVTPDTETYAEDVVFLRENLKRRCDLSSITVQ